MLNPEKAQLVRQDSGNAQTCSLEFLGPFIDSNKRYFSTALESEDGLSAFETREPMTTHCHNTRETWSENQQKLFARRKLIITSVICLIFMIGEVIGGYAAHSLAIMTDAAHLLTDFGSVLLSLFSLWISSRPATKRLNFGWHRSEILGAFLSVLSIWAVTAVLVFIAIQRIINDDYEIHREAMLITSGCAVVVNILMAFVLHYSPSSHSHAVSDGPDYLPIHHSSMSGHGHSHGMGGSHGNTSVRAAFIHVVGDFLQSLGVLLAATIIYFWPEWKIADPICTFLFSFFVLGTTFTILKDVLRVLMEGTPQGIDFDSVKEVLLSVRGVKATHSLHIWALTLSQTMLSVHLATEERTNPQIVLMEVTKLLQTEFDLHSITIQIEMYSDDMASCAECQDPMD